MYNFVFQIALMVSFGTAIYIFAKAVPRIGDEAVTEEKTVSPRQLKFLSKVPKIKIEKIDRAINVILEKALRKIKLFLMRLDNSTTRFLNRVKDHSEIKKRWGEKKNLFESGEDSPEEGVQKDSE